MRKRDKKKIESWARGMNVELLDMFRDVFRREPEEGDDIQLCETDLLIGMECNGDVFAIVDAMSGKVYSPLELGLTSPCLFVDGRFQAK